MTHLSSYKYRRPTWRFPTALLLGLMIAVGCSSREGTPEAGSMTPAPAPPEAISGASLEKPAPSKGVSPAAGERPHSSAVAIAPASSPEQRSLDDYSARILPILKAGDAQRAFYDQMKAAGPQIENEGLKGILPIYDRYDQAVRKAAGQMNEISPPKRAEGVHKAWIAYLGAIAGNLDATLSAMRANDGAQAAKLSKDRKQLTIDEMAKLHKAIKANGFDDAYFGRTGRLVPSVHR